ncbi:MAG: 1-acyl-sn-glycerol-3-phosphate acyltransferase [Chloroflexi bacterium]|jgi:1-acyl-sn-glycerol-3-phosphate acyltransferase|nr:1-acyl-sn-glycerol-3-phosphate acyltransferase [Chloroflexota bacterium]
MKSTHYNPLIYTINHTVRAITEGVCDIESEPLKKIPADGPLILVANHINMVEVPIFFTQLMDRPLTGFSKVENWRHPLIKRIFNMWGLIPLNREEIDLTALRQGLQALDDGEILVISPEGTRSHDGNLQPGHPGMVLMALRSGAPIMPIAHYGVEQVFSNLTRLKRTDFHIRVGDPFYVDVGGARVRSAERQQITDEIMYQIAAMLPPSYRGAYADLDAATEEYLRFDPPAQSSLTARRKEG